jgi:Ca2+-binding EF-hand superfamily protein
MEVQDLTVECDEDDSGALSFVEFLGLMGRRSERRFALPASRTSAESRADHADSATLAW